MCLSPFKEGESRTIELLEDDRDAVDCMIRYMYTLDYDLDVILKNGQITTEEVANQVEINQEIGDDGTPVAESSTPVVPETIDTMAKDLLSQLPGNDQIDKVETRVFDELKLHCQVYALAEEYGIKALMILAREKFQRALEIVDVNMRLFEVVEEIYSSTPDHVRGLRDMVVAKVYSEIQYWLRQPEFDQSLTGMNSFCVDLLKKTVREDLKRYEQAIADVHDPETCNSCGAILVIKRTISRRKNLHLDKSCPRCGRWH